MGRFDAKKTCVDIVDVSITLFKIMIPTLILVKILEELGVVLLLNQVMAPLTMLMGLPVEMAIVLTTTCLLYTSPSPRDLSTSRMPSSA